MIRIPAVIEASAATGRLGLRATAGEDLAGRPILRRTVEKLGRAERVDAIWITAPAADIPALRPLVEGLRVRFFPSDEPDIALRRRLRRGRIWALGSWRGGLGHSYFACEQGRPRSLRALCDTQGYAHVLLVPAEAPLLDPALLDALLAYFEQEGGRKQLYLATSPPGLSADLFSRDVLDVFAAAGRSVDGVLDFRIDAPDHYVEGLNMFHWYPNTITSLGARLCADTDRSLARVRAIVVRLGAAWERAGAQAIIDLLGADARLLAADWPQELVVELTSRRHHAGAIDGPAPPEADLAVDALLSVLAEASARNDVRVTLGILGEPLLHPRIDEILANLAARRPFGLHVHTDALALTDAHLEALTAADPDVVSVSLDAATPETYARLHACEGYARAVENLERIAAALVPRGAFVVPEFALCDENRHELERFYDLWFARAGWVTVRDHDDLAGRRPTCQSKTHLPPARKLCAHVADELALLPDGAYALCRQDVWGTCIVGRAREDRIADVWARRPLACALCERCKAWAG